MQSIKTMLLGLLLVFIGITLGMDFSHVAAWLVGMPYVMIQPLSFIGLLFIFIGCLVGMIGYFRRD